MDVDSAALRVLPEADNALQSLKTHGGGKSFAKVGKRILIDKGENSFIADDGQMWQAASTCGIMMGHLATSPVITLDYYQ